MMRMLLAKLFCVFSCRNNLVVGFIMICCLFSLQVNAGAWLLPNVVCDFYIAMDVICSTSSIFNLVAISIDR